MTGTAQEPTPVTPPPSEGPLAEPGADRRASAPPITGSPLAIAAIASAAAGLVHAAAAGTHAGDRALVVAFAICAAAQLGWAALVTVHPTRRVAILGAILNGGAFLVWLLTRTVGIGFVEPFAEVEAIGAQDLAAAVFAAVSVVFALLVVPTRAVWKPMWSAVAAVAVLVLAVPAMAAEHSHGGAEHAHDDAAAGAEHAHDDAAGGAEHAQDDAAAGAEHAHDDAAAGAEHAHDEAGADAAHSHDETVSGDDHAHEDGTDTATAGGHDHAVPARLDHEPTEEQLDDARRLIAETKAATTKYADVSAAEAAGFRTIGDGRSGTEHYVNAAWSADDAVLDPERPESLVYRMAPDGTKELVTVMYILPRGSTMDDVPDIAGNLTIWHAHDNLCFDPATQRLSGIQVNGKCVPGGIATVTAPMLHVWVTPNPCGPFAGTDAGQMSGSCEPDLIPVDG